MNVNSDSTLVPFITWFRFVLEKQAPNNLGDLIPLPQQTKGIFLAIWHVTILPLTLSTGV